MGLNKISKQMKPTISAFSTILWCAPELLHQQGIALELLHQHGIAQGLLHQRGIEQ
jgi:hypothetical protein